MVAILLKVVEYPKENILELEELSHLGLEDIKRQAEELLDTIDDLLRKERWGDINV